MDRARCNTHLRSMQADDLHIAKLINESKTNNVAYSATLTEYSNLLPQLNLLNMSMNAVHRDTYQTMQDILTQTDNIRTELNTKLNELETMFEENKKIERKALQVKFTATDKYNSAARRVEDTEIANIKE